MNFPRICSKLIDDWVIATLPPSASIVASPPGTNASTLPPSRLSDAISALESAGSRSVDSTVNVTTA